MICIEYCCERFNPHSQAHLQFAQANTHAKNCKRACLSAIVDFADTKKTKSFKNRINGIIGLKKHLKPLKDNNAQLVTRYIKHLADSADFKCSTFNIHRNDLR